MLKIAALCLGLIAAGLDFAQAQDIAGIEDCTKAAGLDKRTGCLQSNVNFLQQLMTKNALSAAKAQCGQHRNRRTKSVVNNLRTSVEQLQAAQKTASDKKTGD